MITINKDGHYTLQSNDSYWEETHQKENEESIKEYNLLKQNVKDKYKIINGDLSKFYSFFVLFMFCGIALTKREAYFNRQIDIEQMKKYLGVWKKKK